MEFHVDEKLVEPIIRDQIAAAVVSQLGNTDDLLKRMVSLALSEKVNEKGIKSQYRNENKYDFVEAIASNAIRKAAQEAVFAIVQDQLPNIQKAVEEHLRKYPKKTAAAIVSAFINTTKSPYTINADFTFNTPS